MLAGLASQINPGELPVDHRTILGVTVGKGTISEVQRKLGAAKQLNIGDAGCSETIICYCTADPKDRTILVFSAHGEMSDKAKTISEFYLSNGQIISECDSRKTTLVDEKKTCFTTPRVSASLKTESGISLDMPVEKLISVIGKPTERKEGALLFRYMRKQNYTEEELKRIEKASPDVRKRPYCFIYSGLTAYITDSNRVFAISATMLSVWD
jgi:hypothetical protein